MKKIILTITAIAVTVCLCGCGTREETSFSREVFAMDTSMTITAYGDNAEKAVNESVAEIERLDSLWSVGNIDSEINMLNENGKAALSEETVNLIDTAIEIYEKTGGAFDITIKPVMEEWGFTTGAYNVPEKDRIDEILKKVDAGRVTLDTSNNTVSLIEGMELDLGGIAKGFTSGVIMDIFEKNGCCSGLVSLGGNVQVLGTKPDGNSWRVAVENPDPNIQSLSESDYIGILNVENKAVITSGGYERFFEKNGIKYHHIIDPKSGYPADSGLISVTIVSDDGCLADGLSTALFIMGKEKAAAFWKENKSNFDAILVDDTGMIYITQGIEKLFESELNYEVIK